MQTMRKRRTTMNNQIDIEAAEAQAAENAYKELWEAVKAAYDMQPHERTEAGLPGSFAEIIKGSCDYRDVIIKTRLYKESQGFLKHTHERLLKDFLNIYGEKAVQAAIKRIQEGKASC